MSDAEEVKISLKVMINKEKTKVLFAESNGDFIDVLLSILALPLGRIVKILDKHYGAEGTPVIGCLNTFYNSVSNLDSSHFWTKDSKHILLNPISSFDTDCRRLKLDISTDCRLEYLFCERCSKLTFTGLQIYNRRRSCDCGFVIKRDASQKLSQADCSDGVFTINTATFIISDDLQIVSDATGLVKTLSILNIPGTEGAEFVNVNFGLDEIVNLFRASMTSQSPLSDVLLNKTGQMNSIEVGFELGTKLDHVENEENPNSTNKVILKITVQKSTNKLLFAHAKKDFVEFLFSLFVVPLGGVEWLLSSKSSIKSIDNLYKSISYLKDEYHFNSSCIKNRLIKPNLPYGCTSTNHILPLTEEESSLDGYEDISSFLHIIFPQGQGKYIKGPRTYQVMDDLTVIPFYVSSILCSLNEQMISLSDLKEVEIEIGLKEALSILKASLISNSALTNGLLNNKQPEQDT
ncbi:hypothetical protein AAHA92_11240 [Salvia divinorum]|uniref:DUF674 family protein n=1 Tax=Salvia divinorum TaxID=28513 RepID=A0ABD1HHQ4_SALDI